MSDHAIGILIGSLLVALILAMIALHRKNRRIYRAQAETERYLRQAREQNPNAWGDVKPPRKR